MTLILTNDDGIDAPGIRSLQQAVKDRGIIVAPTQQYSGCGHQVTTNKPIKVERRGDREYSVDGTPADCTRIASTQLQQDVKWVLSGINAGGNLGVDTYISGTVAAVREAAILGIPGIAISHWIKKPLVIDWDLAADRTAKVLAKLWDTPLAPNSFWNVNLPHLPPGAPEPVMIFCQQSIGPLEVDYKVDGDLYHYRGEYAKRDRTSGTDVDVCFSGNIAITQISL